VTVHSNDRDAARPPGCSTFIAPSQKVATAVLANFKQVEKDKPIRIHPLVTQLVDPAVREKMKVKPVSEAESKEQGA